MLFLRAVQKERRGSLNAEVVAILADEDACVRRRLQIAATLPELDKARAELARKYPGAAESVELIREDRDGR